MNYQDDESELAYTGIETIARDRDNNSEAKSEAPIGSILVHPEDNLTGRDQSDRFLVTLDRSGDIDPRVGYSKLCLYRVC